MLRGRSSFVHSIYITLAQRRCNVQVACIENELGGDHLLLRAPLLSSITTARSSGAVGEQQRGRGSDAAMGLICSAGERGRRRQGEGQGRARMGWVGAGSGGAVPPSGWGRRRVPEGCRRRPHVDREGREI